jgi:hypothetical protein
LFSIGSNIKQLHGDKWYKVIEHNSDNDEHDMSDEEDLNNNQVNNQMLLSNYKCDVDTDPSDSTFFDCFRFRRNYKRNRKKSIKKGQLTCSHNTHTFVHSFIHLVSQLFTHSLTLGAISKESLIFFSCVA